MHAINAPIHVMDELIVVMPINFRRDFIIHKIQCISYYNNIIGFYCRYYRKNFC